MQEKVKKNKYLGSYTLRLALSIATILLLLLVALSLLSFLLFRKTFHSEIEQYTLSKLEFVQESVDANFFSVTERAGLTILGFGSDNAVVRLLHSDVDKNHNLVVSAYEVLRAQQLKLLDFSESINVYYPLSEMILSSTTGVTYLNEVRADEWVRDKEWLEGVKESGRRGNMWTGLRSIRDMASPSTQINVFTYLCSAPGKTPGFLYLNIDERVIYQALEETIFSENGTLFLVDRKGQILSHSEKSMIYSWVNQESWFIDVITGDSFTGFFQIDGKEMVVSAVKSDYLDMYYIYMVGAEDYYQSSLLVSRLQMVILGCFLVVAVVFAFLCAYMSAAPIRNLVRRFQPQSGRVTDIDLIEGIFDEMSSDLRYLNDIIVENRSVVKNTVFMNLLLGLDSASHDFASLIHFAGIVFDKSRFGVIVVWAASEIVEVSIGSAVNVIFTMISDFISEKDAAKAAVVIDKETVCVIINSDQENMSEVIALELSEFLSNMISVPEVAMPIRMGIGCSYSALEELSVSYKDAFKALEYAEIFPEKYIFNFVDYQQRVDHIPNEMIDVVVSSFRKEVDATEMVLQLRDYLRSKGTVLGYHMAKDVLVKELVRVFSHCNIKEDSVQWKRAIEELGNVANLDEFVNGLVGYLQKRNEIELVNVQYTQKAKEYVRLHLDEPITAEEMACMMNISIAHFSRVFKNTAGESYSEYVQRVRMEEVERLLRETKLSVRVIAKRTGFGDNVSYLGRRFKLIYGFTPGEYRRKH